MASSASNVRKTTIFIKSAICAATLVAASFSVTSRSFAENVPEPDPMSVVSINSSASSATVVPVGPPVPEAPKTAGPAVERVVEYRVHRAPVRSNSLAIHVIDLATDREVRLELASLEGVSFNKICRTGDGVKLACGSRARIQFVNLVARSNMICKVAAADEQSVKATSCQIEGKDLGDWIVRSGIGQPTTEGLHVAAVREARGAQRGMWADLETRTGILVASQ